MDIIAATAAERKSNKIRTRAVQPCYHCLIQSRHQLTDKADDEHKEGGENGHEDHDLEGTPQRLFVLRCIDALDGCGTFDGPKKTITNVLKRLPKGGLVAISLCSGG